MLILVRNHPSVGVICGPLLYDLRERIWILSKISIIGEHRWLVCLRYRLTWELLSQLHLFILLERLRIHIALGILFPANLSFLREHSNSNLYRSTVYNVQNQLMWNQILEPIWIRPNWHEKWTAYITTHLDFAHSWLITLQFISPLSRYSF